MPVKDDTITVSSTSDTDEEVRAAAGVAEEEEEEKQEEEEGKEESKEGEKKESEEEGKDEKDESKEDEESEEEKGSAKKEESEEEEEDSDEWPKARKKMLRRINKLTARLKELEGKEPPEEEEEESEEEEEPETVMAEDRPRRKDFKSQEEYEDAITDWRIDQREAKKAIEIAQNERQREFNTYNSHLKDFEDTVDDLDEVRSKVKAANIEIPEGVQVAIVQMDRPDIAYDLAKNHLDLVKEMVEINKTSPTRAVAMLGKYIAEFDGKKEEKKKPAVKTVKAKTESDIVKEVEETVKKTVKPPAAKAPLTVVKGGSGTKTQSKKLDDEEVSYREYVRRREAGES